jgi:hypothetical protein
MTGCQGGERELCPRDVQAAEGGRRRAPGGRTRFGSVDRQGRKELDAISRHDAVRSILTEEQRWLACTEDAVRTVRAWREQERRAYWPLLAWRWTVAVAFALLASVAAGAGYVWAARPYADEIAYLRSRNAFADAVEAGMVRMTPAERRQLDSLLKLPTTAK